MSGSAGLAGKIALVTGGTGGLGTEICKMLLAEGAVVVAGDIRPADTTGSAADFLPLDVTSEASTEAAVQAILERHGRLDVLVNNAGIDLTRPIEEIPVAAWDRIVGVNVRGPFVLSRLAFPVMRRQGSGQIVNIVSTAAKRAWANASAYHASKWGLLGLSHALHVEGRAIGIGVTAVIAGGMRTPFLLDRFPDLDPDLLQEPASVANAVRFALSQPAGTVVPEITVLPIRETSWP
jgi:NAD(P)-dependent dehydrogenase (short-subunit alcohol dehydrogenase family)